jgi:hypothetical protein
VAVKVRVGQTKNVRLVATGEKRPSIVPDSIALGIDTVGPYVRAIDAGVGIVVTPENDTESANLVISHADTSSESGSNNSILEFIRNASVDQFGHVTSLVSTGLDANNFISTNDIISSKNIEFGNTAITLGGSTDEIRGLNLVEIGDFTITDSSISTDANTISFTTTAPLGTIDFGTKRLTGVDNPIDQLDVVNKRYLEFELDRVETTIKVFDDPVVDTDATNKRYVDNLIKGLRVRPAALAATTADLGGTFDSGNSSFSSTITLSPRAFLYIDDVTAWEVGSNLLVKDQDDPLENGSYDLIQEGSANTEWIFQRTSWSDQSDEVPGSYEFVTDGTVNGGTGWVTIVDDASTFNLNTDAVNWVQFQGEGTYNAGIGLTLTGTTFDVNETQTFDVINPANNVLTVSGAGAVKLPVGDSSERPVPTAGMIRFNDVDGQFEGYDGSAWSGLGGTIDLDQDTKIVAEDTAGVDNDELKFFTGGTLAAKFDANTANFYGDVVIAGNIQVGDANTDSITVAADFESNLIPNADRTYSLGSVGKNWSTLFVDTITSDDRIITFGGTGAIAVPSANTSLRPTGPAGMLRFNSDENRFEGWDGTQWSGLAGSVIDLDRNTYIIAESSAGADNNELDFYTAGTQRAQIDASGTFKYGDGLDKFTIDFATGNVTVDGEITATNNLVLNPVGYVDLANNTITNVASPVNPGDVVNLGYLEGQFSSGLTIVDGANTYADGVNLLNSPTIKLGEGLELEELDTANNSFQIGLDKPGNITPGIYGNDRFMPRFRLTSDGRIDFATEIPVELQANAIPNFTETTRDIIGLMISDGIANNANEGVIIVYDDFNNQIYTRTDDPYISLGGDLSGTGQMVNLSNTIIDATITAPFLRTVDVTDANSGIIVTHTPAANSAALLDLDYTYLDARYLETTGGTLTGEIIAPRYVDSDNTNFYMDPAGVSRLNQVEFGYGTTFSQVKFRDGPGSFSVMYGQGGKIGFLDNTFNYAAYSERATGNWVVQNGDVLAERFVDADAQTYFLHPGGTDSNLKQITVEDKITVSDIEIGGNVGNRTIQTTTGILVVDASGGISLNANSNDINANNSKITNLATPTATQDAATKAYVDSVAQGLRVIPAALAGTTIDLGATYDNVAGTLTDASANTAAFELDGVTTWNVGDRVLVKDQTNPEENGSYEVTTVGDGSTAWVLTRGEYFNESSEIPGAFQFITDGTLNAGTGWVAQVTDAETFVLGTDSVVWYQFSGAGTYTAGEALTLTGTEFSITDGDIENVKLANPLIKVNDEAGANTVIALGDTLTIEGTDGVDTTVSNGTLSIAVNELDGGSF